MDGNLSEDYKRREAATSPPLPFFYGAQRTLVAGLERPASPARLIVCLRAEEKIEIVKGKGRQDRGRPQNATLNRAQSRLIAESAEDFAYELTLRRSLTRESPGPEADQAPGGAATSHAYPGQADQRGNRQAAGGVGTRCRRETEAGQGRGGADRLAAGVILLSRRHLRGLPPKTRSRMEEQPTSH